MSNIKLRPLEPLIPVPVNKSALWASEDPGQLLNRRAVMLIPDELILFRQ